jgi:hypothetical protein
VSRDNSKPTSDEAAEDTVEIPALAPKSEIKGGIKANTGRVQFDDRGNAVWQWSQATGAFGREVSTKRLQRLEHPALAIADDASTPLDPVRANPLGTKKGYDPYDSGKLAKTAAPRKKKDLRRLSEFLKLKKQAAANKEGKV